MVNLDVNTEVYTQLISYVENKNKNKQAIDTGEEVLTIFIPTCHLGELFDEQNIFKFVTIKSIEIDASKNMKRRGAQKEIPIINDFKIYTNNTTWVIERYCKTLENVSIELLKAIAHELQARKFHSIVVRSLTVETDTKHTFEFRSKNVVSSSKLKAFLDTDFEVRSKHRILDLVSTHKPGELLDLYNNIPKVSVRRCAIQKKLNVETGAQCITVLGSKMLEESAHDAIPTFDKSETTDLSEEPYGEEIEDLTKVDPYKEGTRITKVLKKAKRDEIGASSLGKYRKEDD